MGTGKVKSLLFAVTFFLSFGFVVAQIGTNELKTGVVIDSIFCDHSPTQSYSLYLPSNYSSDKKWPIIYIFEPAARGSLPVKHFKKAAEKYGYILVSSNNSKNGSWNIVFEAADAMFLDTEKKLSIDFSRRYTSGFSGGSRAALSIAVISGKIRGVIGCGAGLPPVNEYKPKKGATFLYVGIVGNRDMNYQEMIQIDKSFDQLGISKKIIFFEAGHQWPTEGEMIEAIEWMETFIPEKELSFLEWYYEKNVTKAVELINREEYLLAASILDDLLRLESKGLDVSSAQNKLSEIQTSKGYQSEKKAKEKISKKEKQQISKYLEAFTELYFTQWQGGDGLKDSIWWHYEIKALKKSQAKEDKYKTNMAYRLLNLISARCIESAGNYVNNHEYKIAEKLNKIFLMIDDENVYANWHMSKVYALMGSSEKSLDYLERAYEFGMSKPKSILRPEFDMLKKNLRYKNLLKKLKIRNQQL